MFSSLDYNDFLAQLIMHDNPVVIVEGLNDISLFENLLNSDSVIIISPDFIYNVENKKGAVINAIIDINNVSGILNSNDHQKYIGIVDSDFNQICGNCKIISNLFYTATHDIDVQIFTSDALKKMIMFFYEEPDNVNIEDVRSLCLKISSEFGLYLLSLYENDFHSHMKELNPIYDYFDNTLMLDHQKILQKLNEFHINGEFTEEELENIINTLDDRKSQNLDELHLANGHDVFRVLTMLTLWNILNLQKKRISEKYRENMLNNPNLRRFLSEELEDLLRTSYDLAFFKKSVLYQNIKNYQENVNIEFIRDS